GKEFCLRSLQIAEEIESNELLRDDCLCLSDAYEGVGDHTTAFSYYKRYVGYKDSLTNAEHLKAITKTVVKFELEKKSSADSIKAVADKKISDAELQLKDSKLQQEKYLRIYLITGIFLMIITIIIVYRRFRITRTQKRIIEEQKNIVVEKQKEIIDSINYAKKIQMALLKEEEHVSVHLPPHFIFYRPRDIVSGDFYWAMEKQGQLYIAAADCTGHGVPGAFLTMLGIAFLNEINSGDKPLPPSRILEKLRDHFITELSQHGKDHSSFDGMDISLARLDLKTKEVAWCGANNPLYCFINGEFTEFKPNKQPVGFSYEMKAFEDRIIKMNSGDTLYLFTDGFADQFGGPKGKKFKYSRLIETLRSLQDKNMEQQKEELTRVFDDWKGNYEQIDDVCIVGLRL
ncbi:MAG TPA: SpoIIE family protein phosphatase, partial [Bacteroidia bacterium]|nr:SpoIIE family protein phosphatase [Bacteroidia bacterium]